MFCCRADEPFKEYEEFEIDIRMIRAVAVDIGSPQKTIPDVAKTFSFIGDGTASEVIPRARARVASQISVYEQHARPLLP